MQISEQTHQIDNPLALVPPGGHSFNNNSEDKAKRRDRTSSPRRVRRAELFDSHLPAGHLGTREEGRVCSEGVGEPALCSCDAPRCRPGRCCSEHFVPLPLSISPSRRRDGPGTLPARAILTGASQSQHPTSAVTCEEHQGTGSPATARLHNGWGPAGDKSGALRAG